MTPAKPQTVARCVPRQDGGYLVKTLNGSAGSSPKPLSEGVQVIIRDGLALPVKGATHV